MVFICDPTDPPSIVSSEFLVNGSVGTPDETGAGGALNPPVSESTVEAVVVTSGEVQSISYEYFLDGVSEYSGNPYSIVEGDGIPGKVLTCIVTASNVAGSVSTTIEMGVVYGTIPEIPTDITTFADIAPPIGGIVNPGDLVGVVYNSLLTSSGDPDVNSIETIINGNVYTGSSVLHVVGSDESGSNCKIVLNSISVSNENPNIPGTSDGFITRTFDQELAGVQDPVAGNPCGAALGSCCVTGGFDPNTGITLGSCTQETEADCLALTPQGKWTANTPCPLCGDGNVGTPCCDEIGTGRCCCIQTDNTGLCIPDVTAEECVTTDPRFANCGSTDSLGQITWTYGEECPECVVGTPNPPCCAPLTGRCCEVVLENENGRPVGAYCESGLESFDCPQFQESDPTNFQWTPDGTCVDCSDPTLNSGLPCCDPLGRCCLRSGDLRDITYDITEANCEQKKIDEGWENKEWTQNNPNQSSADSGLELDCSDPDTASANPNCCAPLGRCCWKVSDATGQFSEGNCVEAITEFECLQQIPTASIPFSAWTPGGNLACPGDRFGAGCPGDNDTNDYCCDTSKGRCCAENGGVNSCEDNVWYDDCQQSNQTFGNGLVCPDCETENDPDCCNANVVIGDFTFDSDPPKVGETLTIDVDVNNNATQPLYKFEVDGELRQDTLSNEYQIPYFTAGSLSDAGKELKCTVSADDADGETSTAFASRFIDGESFGMPDDIPATIIVIPGAMWDNGSGSLNPGDLVGLSISKPEVDPEISIAWEFQQLNEDVLASGAGTPAIYTIPNEAIDGCELWVNLTFSNFTENAPSTVTLSKRYKIGDVFNPTPNENCGTVRGACCRPDPDNDIPAEGIVGNKCDQQTPLECANLGGYYQGDASSCPTSCGDNPDGCDPNNPTFETCCCPQIKTGKCCCTKTNNMGNCVDDLTYAECNRVNPDFGICAQSYDEVSAPEGSLTGEPLWTLGGECDPGCFSAVDPVTGEIEDRCCDVQTGRCCYIDSAGDRVCEINFTLEDCIAARDSGASPEVGEFLNAGTCPNCEVPEENGDDCCDPLGRCCLRSSGDLRDITYDITEADCEQRRIDEGYENKEWTQNNPNQSSADSGLVLTCSDPDTASNNPNCCPTLGRCCFKTANAEDNETVGFRLGFCEENVTSDDCDTLASLNDALEGTKTFTIGESCPNCGSGDNSESCCDDKEPAFGRCCDNGICIPNQFETDCPDHHDASSPTCPDCTDPNENPADDPSDCCPFGVPVLSIDSFTVDGNLYDPSTNPIGIGSVVTVSTTEKNVKNVSYRFYLTDPLSDFTYDFSGGDTKTLTVPVTTESLPASALPGFELNFEVTADSELLDDKDQPVESLSDNINFHATNDYIHGIPPVFPDDINTLYPDFKFFPSGPAIDPPIVLNYGDLFLYPGNLKDPLPQLGQPRATDSYKWTDKDGNIISDDNFYTISSDGVIENCGIGLQVTLKNDTSGGYTIPGGAEITKIYNIGSIQGPDDTFCGTAVGRCCVQGGFLPIGILSDGQPWGVTYSDCSIQDEETCITTLGGEWNDDINDCSVCSSAPDDHNDTDMGLAPCCDEIPGKCCVDGVCDDFVLFANCTGTWTSYYDDANVCDDACPNAGPVCGCVETGACCCGPTDLNGSCHNDIAPEDCAPGPGSPCSPQSFPQFQGIGTSCPSQNQCDNGSVPSDINEAKCCPAPPEPKDSYCGRSNSGFGSASCWDIASNPLSNPRMCNGVSKLNGGALDYTSPCDYREIRTDASGFVVDEPEYCDVNCICSCFKENDNPGCGGDLHSFGTSTNHPQGESLNLAALCEQAVCNVRPSCCVEQPECPLGQDCTPRWDSQCVSIAESLCTISNLVGSISSDAAEEMSTVLRKEYPSCPQIGQATPCIDETNENWLDWSSCKSKLGVPEGSGELCGEIECPLGKVCSEITEQCVNWSCPNVPCKDLFPSVCESGFYDQGDLFGGEGYRWITSSTDGCAFDNYPYDIYTGGAYIQLGPGSETFWNDFNTSALRIAFGSPEDAENFKNNGGKVTLDINGITKDFFAASATQLTGGSSFIVIWKYLASADPDVKTSSAFKADDLHAILEDMSVGRTIRITIT